MARNGQRACIGSLLLVLSLAVPTWGGQSGPAGAQASPLPGLVVRTDGGSTTLGLDAGGVFHRTPNEVLNQRLIDVPDTSIPARRLRSGRRGSAGDALAGGRRDD
ncbi:MAG: hypothetical protein ACYSUI_16660 [Planctomycetota bacterium]